MKSTLTQWRTFSVKRFSTGTSKQKEDFVWVALQCLMWTNESSYCQSQKLKSTWKSLDCYCLLIFFIFSLRVVLACVNLFPKSLYQFIYHCTVSDIINHLLFGLEFGYNFPLLDEMKIQKQWWQNFAEAKYVMSLKRHRWPADWCMFFSSFQTAEAFAAEGHEHTHMHAHQT